MPQSNNQFLENLFNPNTGESFEGRITDIEDDVEQNTAAIAQNVIDIAQNASAIAQNVIDISQNVIDISQNAADIQQNSQDIATNSQNIQQNTQDIATNASNIQQNSQDIATNSQNIQQNTNWRTDFNSQNTNELLIRDATDSFDTEVYGNNFLTSEIKKSGLGGVLQTQLLRTGDGGGVSFQDTGLSTFSSLSHGTNSAVNVAYHLPKNAGYILTEASITDLENWKTDFNSQTIGNLLYRDATDSFNNISYSDQNSNSTIVQRDGTGNIEANTFIVDDGTFTNTIDSLSLTASRTASLPDKGGTIAMLSDVAASASKWTLSGNNIYNNNSGNVGINNPSSYPSRLTFDNTSESKICFHDLGSGNIYGLGVSISNLNFHVPFSVDNFKFYAGGSNGNGTEVFEIKGSGNVGINNPSSYPSRLTFDNTNESKICFHDVGFGNIYGLGTTISNFNFHIPYSVDNFKFYAGGSNGNGSELARIQGNGKMSCTAGFGVGNTDPQTDIVLGSNSLASNLFGMQLVSTASKRMHVALGQDSTHSGFLSWEYNSTVADALFSFSTYGGANPLYLQRDGGNVGIGHFQDGINSGKALETLDINGTSLTRGTATFWGDTVFEGFTNTIQRASPRLIIRDTTDNDDISLQFEGLTGGVNQLNAQISTANNYLNFLTNTTNNFNGITFGTNNLQAGSIDNNQYWYLNNRVAIGPTGTTPTNALEVSGGVKFNDGVFNNYNPQINHDDTTFKIDWYDLLNPGVYPEKFFKIQQEGKDNNYYDLFSYDNITKHFLTIGNLYDDTSNPVNSWKVSRGWKTLNNDTYPPQYNYLERPLGFTIQLVTQANRRDEVSKQDQDTLTFSMKGHQSNEPLNFYPDRLVSGTVSEKISLDGTDTNKSLNPEYTSQTLSNDVANRSSVLYCGKELSGRYDAVQIKNNVFTPKTQTINTTLTRAEENKGEMTYSLNNNYLDQQNLYGRIVIQKDFHEDIDYNNRYNTTEPNIALQKVVKSWTAYWGSGYQYATPLVFKRKIRDSRDGYSEDTWNCILIGVGTPRQGDGTTGWKTFDFGLQVGTDFITEDCCMGFYCGQLVYDNLTQKYTNTTDSPNGIYYQLRDNLTNASVWTPDSWNDLYSGTTAGVAGVPPFSTIDLRILQNAEGALNTYFFTDNYYNKVGVKADYIPISSDAWGVGTQRRYFFYFTTIQKEVSYQIPANRNMSHGVSKGKYRNIGTYPVELSSTINQSEFLPVGGSDNNLQVQQLRCAEFTNNSGTKYYSTNAVSNIGDGNFIISFYAKFKADSDTNLLVGAQVQNIIGSGYVNLTSGFSVDIATTGAGNLYRMELICADGTAINGYLPFIIPSPLNVWRHYEIIVKRQATNPYSGLGSGLVPDNNFNALGLSKAYIDGIHVGNGCVLSGHSFQNSAFAIGGNSLSGSYFNSASAYLTKVFYAVNITDAQIDEYTNQINFNDGYSPILGITGPRYWYNKSLNESYPFYRDAYAFYWEFTGVLGGWAMGAFPRGQNTWRFYNPLVAHGSPTIQYVNDLNFYKFTDGEYQIKRMCDDGDEAQIYRDTYNRYFDNKALRISKNYIELNNGSTSEIIPDINNNAVGNYVNVNNLTFTPLYESGLKQPLVMEPLYVNSKYPHIPCDVARLVMFRNPYQYVPGYTVFPDDCQFLGTGKVMFEVKWSVYCNSPVRLNYKLMGYMIGPDVKNTNFFQWVHIANNGSSVETVLDVVGRVHITSRFYVDLDKLGRNYINQVKMEFVYIAGGSWTAYPDDLLDVVMYSLPSCNNTSGGIP